MSAREFLSRMHVQHWKTIETSHYVLQNKNRCTKRMMVNTGCSKWMQVFLQEIIRSNSFAPNLFVSLFVSSPSAFFSKMKHQKITTIYVIAPFLRQTWK